MNVELVPLLKLQRDLYRMPRGRERFREYLRTMLTPTADDVELPPLVAMNPMARDHVPAFLDSLLELDAEAEALRACSDASIPLSALPNSALPNSALPGDFKLGLVVADDARGGWTNRYACEYGVMKPARITPRGNWFAAVLWSSGPATGVDVRQAVLKPLFRYAYMQRHGRAHTLRDLLAQEGYVQSKAGCTEPTLDTDDLDYTRAVIEPVLESTDMRTAVEYLFGDDAARTLGFTPQGLSPNAGLALALHEFRSNDHETVV